MTPVYLRWKFQLQQIFTFHLLGNSVSVAVFVKLCKYEFPDLRPLPSLVHNETLSHCIFCVTGGLFCTELTIEAGILICGERINLHVTRRPQINLNLIHRRLSA